MKAAPNGQFIFRFRALIERNFDRRAYRTLTRIPITLSTLGSSMYLTKHTLYTNTVYRFKLCVTLVQRALCQKATVDATRSS